MRICSFIWLIILISFKTFAQSVQDLAVELSAVVQNNPPQITINWLSNANAVSYKIYRKLKSDTVWGSPVATLGGTINTYLDKSVSAGVGYEYKVVRTGTKVTGYGYILSGIEVPVTEYRGKMILLIDSTFIDSLGTELGVLQQDLEGDGWDVVRCAVSRTASVTSVRSVVINAYRLDTINTKALFMIGYIPVPYSGDLDPDGHVQHKGAWSTNAYYGDLNGIWTDKTVNVSPSWATVPPTPNLRTTNVPGDGKFDQSNIPSNMELQVGRLDLSNIPEYPLTEFELLQNYLNKNHAYRNKAFKAARRAVIDDNFGYFTGWAPAASGFKNFGPLVNPSNVLQGSYLTSMEDSSFLWSYGCGGGSWDGAAGVCTTSDFINANLQGVFTILWGSFFGDFDIANDFIRSPLGYGNILTCVWSGNPHWQLHHMGLGEHIGYSTIMTQNNPGSIYFQGSGGYTGRAVCTNLMGDPSLRNDVVAPVSDVNAFKYGTNISLTWNASADSNIIGYHIYRKSNSNPKYTRINNNPVAATSYTDTSRLTKEVYKYMVRAVILQTTPSGSYYNMSQGITDTVNNATTVTSIVKPVTVPTTSVLLYPNPLDQTPLVISGVNGQVEIRIQNISGQIVYTQSEQANNGRVVLGNIQLSTGMYFVSIATDNGLINKKLTVKH